MEPRQKYPAFNQSSQESLHFGWSGRWAQGQCQHMSAVFLAEVLNLFCLLSGRGST